MKTKAYLSLSHWGLFEAPKVQYFSDFEKGTFVLLATQTINGVTYAVHYN